MWQGKLRKQYESYEEFVDYAEMYGLHKRLGYKTPGAAWKANPTVRGSTNPADYRRVCTNGKRWDSKGRTCVGKRRK